MVGVAVVFCVVFVPIPAAVTSVSLHQYEDCPARDEVREIGEPRHTLPPLEAEKAGAECEESVTTTVSVKEQPTESVTSET